MSFNSLQIGVQILTSQFPRFVIARSDGRYGMAAVGFQIVGRHWSMPTFISSAPTSICSNAKCDVKATNRFAFNASQKQRNFSLPSNPDSDK